MTLTQNSVGKIYYGMHFYPGLAQYSEPNKEPFKIFLNENTLRKMDASFAGRPIFVDHVNEVESNLDQLRKESDGWVVESFFNEADGKHWVKFIVVSDRGDRAIKNGFRLSNAYIPTLNNKSGQWNGIDYQNEVIAGEYEHLAIVDNPRYAESVIMTPDEFKMYNEKLKIELNKISNSKPKEKESMLSKLKFWNKKAVENSIDIENISVTLPKSGIEFSIYQIVNAMDEMEMKKKENESDTSQTGLKKEKVSLDVEGDLHNEEDEEDKKKKMKNKDKDVEDCMSNEDEEDEKEDKKAKKKAEELVEHEDKEIKNKKMKNSGNFEKLKNANTNTPQNFHIELAQDKVARGISRYGSN